QCQDGNGQANPQRSPDNAPDERVRERRSVVVERESVTIDGPRRCFTQAHGKDREIRDREEDDEKHQGWHDHPECSLPCVLPRRKSVGGRIHAGISHASPGANRSITSRPATISRRPGTSAMTVAPLASDTRTC